MRFSPDGWHLLGGVGAIGVFLDGRQIAQKAGGWDFLDGQTVMGPGGYDGPMPGFYRYPLPSGPEQYVNALLATNFYANGLGSWVRYLADNITGSTDSAGNSWPGRIALGFEGIYQIFTDTSWVPLIFRDITTGYETVRPSPQEWEILPDGSTYFSRNYRGIFFADVFWACGYQAAFGGLCIWRPFALEQPTYLLSTDLDFNPDISKRPAGSDSYLVVGSGQNQGETAQHLYEINLSSMQFRKDNGPWQPLTGATPPEPEPLPPVNIAPFHHPQWVGPFFATGQYGNVDHHGSTEILIRANYSEMVRPRPVFAGLEDARHSRRTGTDRIEAFRRTSRSVPEGKLLGIYMSAIEGGAEDANLQEAIAYAEHRGVPSVIYVDLDDYPQSICDKWLNYADGTPIPNRIPCVRGYPAAKQMGAPLKATPEEDVARIRATVERLTKIYERVALAHTYYTQADGTKDNYPLSHILGMQNGLGDIERDLKVFLSLGFSRLRTGGGDMSKYPELLDAFNQECAAVTAGTPSPILLPDPDVPVPPQPEPPQPEPPQPEPPQPEPQPPNPEVPTMKIGDLIMIRRHDIGPSERPGPNGGRPDFIKGVVVQHQDEAYLANGNKIYGISLNFPTGVKQIAHFTSAGEIDGTRDVAGGDERVTFDGTHCMVARPACGSDGRGVSVLWDMVKL